MPLLNKFTFNIRSSTRFYNQFNLPSNEYIQQTFKNFKNKQIISSVDYFQEKEYSQCHIYSYPYELKNYDNITNNFPGEIFQSSFPFLEKLTLINQKRQNNKQYRKSKNKNQDLLIIEDPYLMELDLSQAQKDYHEQFLFDTKTCLPNNVRVIMDYRLAKRVTRNFRRNTTRSNCAKMSFMIFFLHLLLIIYFTNATYLYFDRDSYDIFLSESTEIHTKISLIKAISSPSISIQYELHGDTNKTFYLNSQTGELILLNLLDYETISIYKLTIEARSLSIIIAPCFSELIIHILNINDNLPEINLIIYPSVLYEKNIIKYDLNSSSTPFATINLKDLDESTKNLNLFINDTKHFQIQLIRKINNNLIYILSTNNNSQFIYQDYYYLLLYSCDNDQPLLCINQTYKFYFKSNEYLCNLSFNQKNYIIDIKENLSINTLIMHKITNKFCQNLFYSINDKNNFYIDSSIGDLYTLKKFNRIEQSIYIIYLYINNYFQINILIRILDQYGNIPFLLNKYLIINQKKFFFIHLFNSTLCRSQIIIEKYFQILSNCTILPLIKPPPKGQYLFNIELSQRINYQDTFLLELKEDDEEEEERLLTFTHIQWIMIIPIILSILFILGIIICVIIIIKQERYRFSQLCHDKQKASPLSINDNNEDDKSHYNKYDISSTISQLKVHDDHELSSSLTSTAIYFIQKPSPPLSSLSPIRDDEGYSGSSDVSENNHLPFESTIISANQLLEQYRIHEFHNHQLISPIYDVPRRYIDRMNVPCISPDVSLV